jgi:hypothetical protein
MLQYLGQAHGIHFLPDRKHLPLFSAKRIGQARFRLLTAEVTPGIVGYKKRGMKSKTVEDSERMVPLDARKRL